MNETHDSLRNIFVEALEIEDTQQRAAYLSQACGEDLLLPSSSEYQRAPACPRNRAQSKLCGPPKYQKYFLVSLEFLSEMRPPRRLFI